MIFVLLVLVSLLGGYLVLIPGPLNSAAYHPLPAPVLAGVLAPNDKLKTATLIGRGQIMGAEDVAVDARGRVYGGHRGRAHPAH